MRARVLPVGAAALLVEVAETHAAVRLRAALAEHLVPGAGPWGLVDHLVVGARTVLVVLRGPGRADEVGRACLSVAEALPDPADEGDGGDAPPPGARVVEVPVRYDGPDLDDVARLTGLTREEVVRAHTGATWRVGFGGFAPGFAYLVGGDERLRVPRRADPRPRVPAGSVALAGEFAGIYPHDSPGGWQLLGSTSLAVWDERRDPPALLAPGDVVRFVEETHPRAPVEAAGARATGSRVSSTGRTADRAMPRGVEVLATGPLTLVQDLGRPGLADAGVGRSGAADPAAYLLGLRLLGHRSGPGDAHPASLEVTLGGLSVRARGHLLVALTGAPCPATVDGRPVPHAAPVVLADGQVLTLGAPRAGLRTWLAVRGGIAVDPVLGSRSTDTLARLGPPVPAVGDVLPVGPPPRALPHVDVAPHRALTDDDVVLDLLPGPRAGWCDLDDLVAEARAVSSRSNRVGIRLEGKQIRWTSRYADRELPSEGLVPGAVQVPPGGEPVLFLADHPVTGGYPVVAVVTPASLPVAAQLRPGQRVRLRLVR
ncbi:5-oxoprolinase/urea amidolyase family protein [Terrabacter sp. NPDC000476]|uniref:5-oxoprolinase subunit B/C family protein n=1 Tax=Terrabacter sp. NPDC000476 TaxID=3154258 RepID=UPI00331C414B